MRKVVFAVLALFVLSLSTQTVIAQVGVLTGAGQKGPKVALTKVAFGTGVTYDGKTPPTFDSVVKVIKDKYPDATFGFRKVIEMAYPGVPVVMDEILEVGLDPNGPKANLGFVLHRSNCPNNSKYLDQTKAEVATVVQPMLEELTRVYHAERGLTKAPVKEYKKDKEGRGSVEVVLQEKTNP